MKITREFLKSNKNFIFVFGDNSIKKGRKGGASLRDLENTYGFITKKYPCNKPHCFYTIEEYKTIYKQEINKLKAYIRQHSDKIFLISKIGSGLANRYGIFESIIKPNIKRDLSEFKNIIFL